MILTMHTKMVRLPTVIDYLGFVKAQNGLTVKSKCLSLVAALELLEMDSIM